MKVFVEREGVILSLYGKVELETQKAEVEDALRKQPGVIDATKVALDFFDAHRR